jgi:CubicO group peptidase (beta-lactamase class C family)
MQSGPDNLNDCVAAEMQAHNITGVSLAIVRERQIVAVRAYGHLAAGERLVDPETLFQAASISKVTSALAALMLAEKGILPLDEDVNALLSTWKVPENEFTKEKKVTVRRILSHTAGLGLHGFPGYARGRPLPALADILDGKGSANTDPVLVESVPGSVRKYSGGGYTVLQQLMIDVTGKQFPALMRELVLEPLEMDRSTFEQPLPAAWHDSAACGHMRQLGRFRGNWNVYPEMAAAGLWTTPSDLARLVIALQRGKAGYTGVVPPNIAEAMTTPVVKGQALGLAVGGSKDQIFGHDGRTVGFDSRLQAVGDKGVLIMLNANDDSGVIKRICRAAWDATVN